MGKVSSIIIILVMMLSMFSGLLVIDSVKAICPCEYDNYDEYENQYGHLVVYPAFVGNFLKQKQYWNFTSNFSATIDIAFRFNYTVGSGGFYVYNNQNDVYNKLSVEKVEHGGFVYYVYWGLSVVKGNEYHGYWEYETPYNSSGKWNMLIKRDTDPIGTWRVDLDPWWNGSYNGRYDLYVNATQVPSDLTNFPVWVEIRNNTRLHDNTQADLDDIVFVSHDNTTVLNYELVEYTKSNGKLNATYFVNITSLDDTVNTHFNLYYDNSMATDQSDTEGTWSDGYFMVHHFEESDIDGGSDDITDSTSNNNDGTTSNMDGSDDVQSRIGHGFDFDGTNDYITVSYDASMNVDYVTVIGYHTPHTMGGDAKGRIITKRHHNDNRVSYGITCINISNLDMLAGQFYDENGNSDVVEDTENAKLDTYTSQVATFDTSFDAKLYINNNLNATFTSWNTALDVSSDDLVIGSEGEFLTTRNYDGVIDELWLYDGELSRDYLTTLYANLENYTGTSTPFVIWGGYHTYSGDDYEVTNVTPSHTSYFCNDVRNLTELSVHVENIYGYNFNLTITLDQYNESYNNVGNGTYNMSLVDVLPYGTTNFSWNLNVTGAFCVGNCTVNNTYTFDVCWDALLYMQNNNSGGDVIEWDITQFSIVLEIILFVIFMWLGRNVENNNETGRGDKSWHFVPMSAGLFYLFASFVFIGMGVELQTYISDLAGGFVMAVGIIILLYATFKAFYYTPD